MCQTGKLKGHTVERDFPLGEAPPFITPHGNYKYYRVYSFGVAIKARHRATGHHEDSAFKQSIGEGDAYWRRHERHMKKQEQEAKG